MKINSMAFSPDGQLLAVVCDDGALTIMDYINERVLDVFRSYYGAIMCVTWSPDGRYVLTGGQDDLVSIWSIADSALVARCVGHESWVTDVKFDPWRCDERNYRFGSVGEDCRLLLWDFSVGMLGRPKPMSVRNRGSLSSTVPLDRKTNHSTVNRFRSNSSLAPTATDGLTDVASQEEGEVVVHPVDSKASTAVLPPVMSKQVDDHPLAWVGFEESCIITSCKEGKSDGFSPVRCGSSCALMRENHAAIVARLLDVVFRWDLLMTHERPDDVYGFCMELLCIGYTLLRDEFKTDLDGRSYSRMGSAERGYGRWDEQYCRKWAIGVACDCACVTVDIHRLHYVGKQYRSEQ